MNLFHNPKIDQLGQEAKLEIFSRCKPHLDEADMVVALLDGPQVDNGSAWEIGRFQCKKITRKENYRRQNCLPLGGRK